MSTVSYSCGCLISRDMFSGAILVVIPCNKHANVIEIQTVLKSLARVVTIVATIEDSTKKVSEVSNVQC